MESFGRLGVEGGVFNDQLAVSVVGRRGGGSMARKGVVKEVLLLIVSATTGITISRKVLRFKLPLRDRQEARRGGGRGWKTDQHRWRGNGAWMRLRISEYKEHVLRRREQIQPMEHCTKNLRGK